MARHRNISVLLLTLGLMGLVSCSHGPQTKNSDSSDLMSGTGGATLGGTNPDGTSQPGGSGVAAAKGDIDSIDTEHIPEDINEAVLKWVSYFQGRGRKLMEKYLERSARYSPIMLDILRKNGLPDDILYISLIESGFSGTARSHAGAVGYWQFIRGTGKSYGLRINAYADERRDPVRSTEAAAAYLKGLYNLFGSWYLAIASYNVGENRVKRQVMNHYTRDFWELAEKKVLPRETIDYVPKFIAARMIAKNPSKYGFENLNYMAPYRFDEIRSDSAISLRKLAKAMGMTYEEIKELNPSFKGEIATFGAGSAVTIRVPDGRLETAKNEIENCRVSGVKFVVQDDLDRGAGNHRIRPGDTLSSISRRYGVSVASLRTLNELGPRSLLRAGGSLKIPGSRPRGREAIMKSTGRVGSSVDAPRKKAGESNGIHIVRRGDTLIEISRRYRIPLRTLASANGLRSSTRVQAGKRLVIPD